MQPVPTGPSAVPIHADPVHERLTRLRRYARLMDARYAIPGTRIRFGLDGLIGLLPGVGDVAALGLSSVPVIEAVRGGVGKRTIARMLLNLGVDFVVGTIPIIGDVFDVWFKCNIRNVRILERALMRRADR